MIIIFMAVLIGTDKPSQAYFLAGIETLLEALMISALIGVMHY